MKLSGVFGGLAHGPIQSFFLSILSLSGGHVSPATVNHSVNAAEGGGGEASAL